MCSPNTRLSQLTYLECRNHKIADQYIFAVRDIASRLQVVGQEQANRGHLDERTERAHLAAPPHADTHVKQLFQTV